VGARTDSNNATVNNEMSHAITINAIGAELSLKTYLSLTTSLKFVNRHYYKVLVTSSLPIISIARRQLPETNFDTIAKYLRQYLQCRHQTSLQLGSLFLRRSHKLREEIPHLLRASSLTDDGNVARYHGLLAVLAVVR
jgi:hypothetical protein